LSDEEFSEADDLSVDSVFGDENVDRKVSTSLKMSGVDL
jgi:hypothetical protein